MDPSSVRMCWWRSHWQPLYLMPKKPCTCTSRCWTEENEHPLCSVWRLKFGPSGLCHKQSSKQSTLLECSEGSDDFSDDFWDQMDKNWGLAVWASGLASVLAVCATCFLLCCQLVPLFCILLQDLSDLVAAVLFISMLLGVALFLLQFAVFLLQFVLSGLLLVAISMCCSVLLLGVAFRCFLCCQYDGQREILLQSWACCQDDCWKALMKALCLDVGCWGCAVDWRCGWDKVNPSVEGWVTLVEEPVDVVGSDGLMFFLENHYIEHVN